MRYQIPIEAPRGPYAHLAVRATAPYWTALIAGALPGVIWGVANAYFLDCRDKRRQAIVAGVGYGLILAMGALRLWLYQSGAFDRTLHENGALADALMMSAHFLAVIILLRYLAGRQIDVAAYRASLGRQLPWGLLLIGGLAAFNYFFIPPLYRWNNAIFWIWGPMLV